jgi:hypothetical protein
MSRYRARALARVLAVAVAGAGLVAIGQPALATASHRERDCCSRDVSGWRVVWRDDFDGPAGSPVDGRSWIHDLGHCYDPCVADNWGTGEVTDMTDSPANSSLDGDGHLLITPLRDAAGHWTSARLETRRADFAAVEGGALRVEGRFILPQVTGDAAQGYWSAFWMLGSGFRPDHVDRSGAGDIDILEHINGPPAHPEIIGAAHCSPPVGDPCNEDPDNEGLAGSTRCRPTGCLSGFHTLAVEVHRECSPQRIDWLVDGRVYHSVRADQPGMDAAVWKLLVDRSFFIILNQSIGGTWPKAPTGATRSGAPLVVDRVVVSVRTTLRHGGRHHGHTHGHTHGHSHGHTHGHPTARHHPGHDGGAPGAPSCRYGRRWL